jgi:multiple antibiotic resistance protein
MPSIPLDKLFVLLFMMTGPLRVIPGFAALSDGLDANQRSRLAFRGILFASIGVILAIFIGTSILRSWNASPQALAAATGLLLFLTALQALLGRSGIQPSADSPSPKTLDQLSISPLALPTILPPFAVGVLILFGAYFPNLGSQLAMAGLALAILAVDWVGMRYAAEIMSAIGPSSLQVLGAIFGVLQLSLAIEMIFWAIETSFTSA